MKLPDKVPYRKSELIAEIISLILGVGGGITLILLTVLGIRGASSIICGIVLLFVCGAFSIVSVYPQWTNMVTEKECSEKHFRRIRKSGIIAKFVLIAALIALSLL